MRSRAISASRCKTTISMISYDRASLGASLIGFRSDMYGGPVRPAARLRSLAHDDVDGLAQIARRFPEDFLAVARADAVERFQDRLLDGVDLGDVAKLATVPLGNG